LNLGLGNRINDDSPLWNSASGKQLDLGRVGIPRGKGRQGGGLKKFSLRSWLSQILLRPISLRLRLIRPLAEAWRENLLKKLRDLRVLRGRQGLLRVTGAESPAEAFTEPTIC